MSVQKILSPQSAKSPFIYTSSLHDTTTIPVFFPDTASDSSSDSSSQDEESTEEYQDEQFDNGDWMQSPDQSETQPGRKATGFGFFF